MKTATLKSTIEDVLLSLLSTEFRPYKRAGNRLNLSTFKETEIFIPEVASKLETKDTLYFTKVHPRDISYKADVSLCWGTTGEVSRRNEVTYVARFHLRPGSPISARLSVAHIYPDGHYEGYTFGVVFRENRWRIDIRYGLPLDATAEQRKEYAIVCEERAELERILTIAPGVEFARSMYWRLIIGLNNGPSVSIPTDATGAREIIEARRGKRKILGWITDHWRQFRIDPDMETYVRNHLRGTNEFDWDGYTCSIKPSVDTPALVQKHIANRKEMRRQGMDRRLRCAERMAV